MSRTKQPTYSQALSELEGILKEIESGDSDLDLLAEKVRRAVFLIGYCRRKLRGIEDEVGRVLADVEQDVADRETEEGTQSDV